MATNKKSAKSVPTESDTLPAGDEPISRKKLAGQGPKQEAGTVFGSRWTNEERDALQMLVAQHGREIAIELFVVAYPHRTPAGCRYQIDRHTQKVY